MSEIRVAASASCAASSEVLRRVACRGVQVHDGAVHSPILVLCSDAGLDLVELVKDLTPRGLERVIVVANGELLSGPLPWRLMAAGASEVVDMDCPAQVADLVKARVDRWEEVDGILASALVRERLVGTSPAFVKVLRQIVEVAAFTSAGILLLGESGTGKEQLARLVHDLDRRAGKRDLVTLDCTTVVPELSGSEFFGHERGAFTGAIGQREGAFALAHGGTLFLDEVGELGLALQAQLLRAVQERTYKRIGGNQWHSADFRLLTATNRELAVEVEERAFRRDFYHRIASWSVRLPSLRERPEDVLPLAEHFARHHFRSSVPVEFDRRTQEFLASREYPGNVRELRQLVTRLCARHVGAGPITIGDIAPADLPDPGAVRDASSELERAVQRAVLAGTGLKEIGRAAREVAIGTALEVSARNVQQAARLLKVTDRALQMELAKREA